MDAGNVDDTAPTGILLQHLPANQLGQKENGFQIDPDNPLPIFRAGVEERLGEVDPGVVDQAINAAEGVHRFGQQALLVIGIADITGHCQRVFVQAGDDILGRGEANLADNHFSPLAVANPGDPFAQPAPRAGDDNDFVFKQHFSILPTPSTEPQPLKPSPSGARRYSASLSLRR